MENAKILIDGKVMEAQYMDKVGYLELSYVIRGTTDVYCSIPYALRPGQTLSFEVDNEFSKFTTSELKKEIKRRKALKAIEG